MLTRNLPQHNQVDSVARISKQHLRVLVAQVSGVVLVDLAYDVSPAQLPFRGAANLTLQADQNDSNLIHLSG